VSDDNLLALLRAAQVLGIEDDEDEPVDDDAPETDEAPRQTPEMARATRLCRKVIHLLLKEELLELVSDESAEPLADYLLIKLTKSRSQKDTIRNWIAALSDAREVEDLFGTDEQLMDVMNRAFDEIAREEG